MLLCPPNFHNVAMDEIPDRISVPILQDQYSQLDADAERLFSADIFKLLAWSADGTDGRARPVVLPSGNSFP